jgi:hypothetical protein
MHHSVNPTNYLCSQWGNLLTLAACYKDEILRRFIDADTLSTLFSRTIAFFKSVAQPSSALTTDMNMLIGLAKELGFTHEETDTKAGSSFSSATSGGILPPMQHPINSNNNNNNNYHFHGISSPSLMRPY